MSTNPIKPWIEMEGVSLHPDVTSENFSEDIFALDLGPLADGNPNVPAVYRDPEHFFRSSYLTAGLRSLLNDVLARLGGVAGNRVLKLITAFGGGKSHTLAGLMHAARDRDALDAIPEGKGLPRPGKVRTAVFDGQFFDATNGKTIVPSPRPWVHGARPLPSTAEGRKLSSAVAPLPEGEGMSSRTAASSAWRVCGPLWYFGRGW